MALGLTVIPSAWGQSNPQTSYAPLQIWRLEHTGYQADLEMGDAPLSVGSIQKPFVVKAWATAHPGDTPPRITCDSASRCWLHQGHGTLDLSMALTLSCNAYFRSLAEATPMTVLASTLKAEGFSHDHLSADSAIGLPGGNGLLTIRPSALLEAYVRLVKSPWPLGESVRRQVLAGLRKAALTGTAALGQRGYWAKTGTVPLVGDPLHTSGFALAVDDTGWAILARLARGSGREAAAALGEPLARLRPWNMAHPTSQSRVPRPRRSFAFPPPIQPVLTTAAASDRLVTVRMMDLLGSPHFKIRNVGSSPVPTDQGYLGPGGSLELRPGVRLGPGLLEITAANGLQRRIEGELRGERSGKTLKVLATLSLREYANGVLAAELTNATSERRVELGAAILRFLDHNHRHGDADVCDSTHCAWFIGRGPRQDPAPSSEPLRPLTDAEWSSTLEFAKQPGPSQWTSHCGGTPLSPHRLWGFGDHEAPRCPHHGSSREVAETRPWVREWRASDVERAFGASVTHLEIGSEGGVWVLRTSGDSPQRRLRYDEAHRTLATILGWGALPSPAGHVEAIPGGFRATGVGLGHRVGLCLGD